MLIKLEESQSQVTFVLVIGPMIPGICIGDSWG